MKYFSIHVICSQQDGGYAWRSGWTKWPHQATSVQQHAAEHDVTDEQQDKPEPGQSGRVPVLLPGTPHTGGSVYEPALPDESARALRAQSTRTVTGKVAL